VQVEAKVDLGSLSRRFRPALMAFFVRRLHNHAEAEDLTQEVLVRLAAHTDTLKADRPDAYVFQAAANLLRDRARKAAVRARYGRGQGAIDAGEVEERDPDRVLLGRVALATVTAALKELPERTRSIFILFRLENMKQREIADMYGLSLRVVERHVVKASLHLRARLGEDR
jgi:RNA polymerase sigma-70 factor (ECF subfamily)